jgi:hypothetical protein
MNAEPDGFMNLGRSPSPLKMEAAPEESDKKYYPSLHFDGKMSLPDEGEAHIRFRKHETVTRKDKGGEHQSHSFEVTAIKPLGKKNEASKGGLSKALDEIEGNKIQKAQAKEINDEEKDEED